jgi:hypothetical protein
MTLATIAPTGRASWQIKDTAVLAELRQLMDVTDAEAALLGTLQDAARAITPQLATAFYDRLMRHANTADYLANTSLNQRHQTIGQWFAGIFGGSYGDEYVAKRLVIGQVHVRIGLPVRYPLAMIDVVMEYGEQVTRQSTQPEQALAAFRKLLALDVAIFNQAYEDNQIAHIAELVGGERLARLLLTGAA